MKRAISFKNQVTMVTAAGSALTLVLAFGALLSIRRGELREEARTDLESLARIVGDTSAAPLSFRDAHAAKEGLRGLAVKPQIVTAGLYAADGTLWVTYHRQGSEGEPMPSAAGPAGFYLRGSSAVAVHHVEMDGERIGSVHLTADLRQLSARWRSYTLTLSAVLIGCALAALAVSARLQGPVSGPIQRLAQAARRVSDQHDYSVRVASSGVRELHELGDAFNGMLSRIQEQDAALRSARDGLEERVAERVADLRREVQERQQAERALNQSEGRYRSIVETTNEWIWAMDREGLSLYDNPAVEQILGYAPAELRGQSYLNLLHEEDRLAFEKSYPQFLAAHTGWTGMVLRFRHKNGGYRVVESNAVPMLDEHGGVIGFQGSDRDITEARLLEEQFRQSQKMEAVGRLAGGVAHDFNNLLGVILGYSEMVLRRDATHPGADKIREIEKAALRAAALTKQLLAFSRKQVLEPKVVDLGGVITDLGRMLRRLIGEDVRLGIVTAPGLAAVKADPTQLEQVIVNLVVNARNAMPTGGELTLSTRNLTVDSANRSLWRPVPPGDYVMLSVRDTGCGMSAETQSHMFEPFFTTKESGKGTGLGLATVYGIVKQTNGHIAVESAPGQGSTFSVFLPRVAATVAVATAAVPLVHRRGHETILVVEDEPSLRELTREVLEDHGYTVRTAADGREALDLTRGTNEEIHLVLTDVVMPGLGGRALAERLALERPRTRIVFMSGYAADIIAQHGVLEAGMMLLHKPFSPDALLLKVEEALGGSLGVPVSTTERASSQIR